ncbi:unnamed protein product [Ceutorhynchus assimilis]|uniref:CCHC-type domain-containing protein n=1 Tax=Ceutorhynchus assimilis TaxID=467358 RepID=A0A9N9N1K0_9CUCU|nr:unnamed protein product [Ceutorhynchus assimilis]
MCKKDHSIYSCPSFLELSPGDRLNRVRKINACTNCLRQGHTVKDCKSKFTCRKCSNRRISLLHINKNNTNEDISRTTNTIQICRFAISSKSTSTC